LTTVESRKTTDDPRTAAIRVQRWVADDVGFVVAV
jgi:hypothetical protein